VSLLWTACADTKSRSLQLLIAATANVEAKDNNGTSALLWAAREGYVENVQLRVDANASFDVECVRCPPPLPTYSHKVYVLRFSVY